jgi:hypothetical protein
MDDHSLETSSQNRVTTEGVSTKGLHRRGAESQRSAEQGRRQAFENPPLGSDRSPEFPKTAPLRAAENDQFYGLPPFKITMIL